MFSSIAVSLYGSVFGDAALHDAVSLARAAPASCSMYTTPAALILRSRQRRIPSAADAGWLRAPSCQSPHYIDT